LRFGSLTESLLALPARLCAEAAGDAILVGWKGGMQSGAVDDGALFELFGVDNKWLQLQLSAFRIWHQRARTLSAEERKQNAASKTNPSGLAAVVTIMSDSWS
jgi:hypothetical protein